ncbi:MAG TPA: sigma-70 factor domain-containing protein, partial [Polyangiaceae bacterium]
MSGVSLMKMNTAAAVEASSDDDAIRAYYRKLGKVSLLTREGEVELARRIENADAKAVRALVRSAVAVRELALVAEELAAGLLKAREITRNPADEEDEDNARHRLVRMLRPVGELERAVRNKAGVPAKRESACRALEQV